MLQTVLIQYVALPAADHYVVIRDKDGKYYNNTTNVFETYNAPDWATAKYVLALTKDTSGFNSVAFPAAIIEGVYTIDIRIDTGVEAVGDVSALFKTVVWSGPIAGPRYIVDAPLETMIDVITAREILDALLAVNVNKAVRISTSIVSFKDYAGTAEKVNVTYGSTRGARDTVTIA